MRRCWYGLLALVVVATMFTPTWAADGSTETQMAAALGRCVQTLKQISTGGDPAAGFGRLKSQEEQIRQLHLLLEDKFERRAQRLNDLGSNAVLRHQGMRQAYRRVMEDFLDRMEDIESVQDLTTDAIEDLLEILKPVGPQKAPPIFGSLPYTHLGMAAVKPDRTTTVVPAYLNPSAATTDADLAASPYAPRSQAISELAESLGWKPANIFDWVKNNVATQWYWGCMKGAEETLRQKSGNDCDQAALLVALLRASGYPSRYVRGVIRFFPDIAAASKLIGVDSDADLLFFIQSAGIPHEVTFSGQKIETLAVEHVWVETQVPYANYRGAVIDTHGKAWVGLDTSIKTDGFEEKSADPIVSQLVLSSLRDLYLWQMHDGSPLEFLRSEIETQLDTLQSSNTYDGLLRTRVQRAKNLKILPNALQFDTVQVTAEFTALPEQLVHTVEFTARSADGQIFYDQAIPTPELSNRQVLLTFEPQTVDDQEIINSFGGLDNTPSYLIRLRPVIEVDGQRRIVGSGGLPSGATFFQTITLVGPNGRQQFDNSYVMGNLALMGIFAQQAVMPSDMAPEEKNAARLLHETAARYAIQWQAAEDELAALLGITLVRPAPAVVTTAGVMEVTELIGQPHDITWKGVYVDADFRAVEAVGGTAMDDGGDPRVLFMQLSGLQGSYLEGQTLEESFQVDGISTAALMGLAAQQQIETVRIDAANIDAVLPTLFLADNIEEDIVNAVNQNLIVRIPTAMLSFEDWTGMGYLKENPRTGEAGYMLSGMIAGGMTAWGIDRWEEYYHNRMTYSYTGEVNDDPEAAVDIVKITATDMQMGVVGMDLDHPMQVLVRDKEGKPVRGAKVEFFTKAGGGKFDQTGLTRIEAWSNTLGIASAPFILGTQTKANPTFLLENGKTYPQQVGENIVSAVLVQTGAELAVRFTEYGFPGDPDKIELTSSGGLEKAILRVTGYLKAVVTDGYGNHIANAPITFEALPAQDTGECDKPTTENRPALLFDINDACMDDASALYGECASAASTKQVISENDGAYVYVMMGGLNYAIYDFTASLNGLQEHVEVEVKYFGYLHSGGVGRCHTDLTGPQWDFIAGVSYPVDANGNNINAAKATDKITLKAVMQLIREGGESVVGCPLCPKDGDTPAKEICCSYWVGTRVYNYSFDMDNPQMYFDAPVPFSDEWKNGYRGELGTYLGEGKFTYEYEVKPGVNYVRIEGFVDGVHSLSAGGTNCYTRSCDAPSPMNFSGQATNAMFMVIYGVSFNTDSTVNMHIDETGRTTCDIPIAYDIQPKEYQTSDAYLMVYRDGKAIAAIPTEGHGQDTATIGRGFQFDDGVPYTAQIVLNPGSGVEIKSDPIILQPATDVEVKRLEIVDYDKDEGCLVPIGGSRKIKAITSGSAGVKWTITHVDVDESTAESAKATIESLTDPFMAVITAQKDSGSGWITVRATDKDNPCIYKEARVYIGCSKCNEGSCEILAGGGFIQLSSIDITIGLGPGKGGQPAGQLFIRSKDPDDTLYTPEGLMLSTTTNDVEARYGADHLLRQVMAPETMVDIRVHDASSYSLNFYRPEAVTGEQDGLYRIDSGAQPIAVWTMSPYGQGGLKVKETRDGQNREHIYQWDTQLGTWTLSKANGSQIISRKEEQAGDDRIVTRVVKDAYGNIASKTSITYRKFEWGDEVVTAVVDPEGEALTTTTEYYDDPEQTGSYGRIARQVNPDGSWTRHEYDDQGRTTVRISPWLDSGPDSDSTAARVTANDYTPVDPADSNDKGDSFRPRTITETIAGQTVSKTYYAYIIAADGTRTEISERCASVDAAYGDAANQRTVSVYFPSDTGNVDSGRIKSTQYPDGRLDSYTYDTGNYMEGDSPGLFVPFTGDDVRTMVVRGTVDHPDGVAFKTTRDVTIASSLGRTLLQATEVYDGSGYQRIAWSIDQYNEDGRVIATRTSDGRLTQSSWSCCGKESDTDAAGQTTYYTYDDLKRVKTRTREGVSAGAYAAQSDIKTVYAYDALGRVLTTTVLAGDLSQTSSSTYDPAGRLRTSIDPAGLKTSYDYSPDGLSTTVTAPGNVVQTTTRHLDGRTAGITGSAAPGQYYSYGVNADGSQWTEVRTGAPDSPMVRRTVADMLGRTVREEKPGAAGMEITENFYDARGRLIRTRTSGQADTLYVYDELGNAIQSGLDANGNNVLEPASADRITAGDTAYTEINGQWWQQSIQQVYPVDNDGTPVTVSIQRSQISGLADDGEAAESVSIDIHGNATVSRTYVDRDLKTRTQIIDYPDATIDAQTVSVNGLVMETRSKSGVTTTLAYDALGRRTGATDPRTGTAVTHYDNRGRVDYIQDAAGHRTEFAYNPNTGRRISQADALGKITRFDYNNRGQVTRTWGDGPYPVQYEYDDYGRMTAMTTYRAEAGFDAESFPTSAAGDTTRWHYDEATGLLTAKEYADGSQVTYTYTAGGRLDTRTWARQDNGQPLTTTYSYDPATGELTLIDYSDGTPDITFAYDRLGRQSEIGDALGTHTFDYSPNLQLQSETVTGLYDAVLTRTYETIGVAGRPSGFTLGAGYSVNYAYAPDTGRFQSLTWNAGGQTDTATYSYVPDTDLLQGHNTTAGLQATYAYEPHRNLKTSVQNSFNSTLVSQYDYQYDPVGRRTSVANTGSAFAQAAFNRYGYNDRSELIASDHYMGTDVDNPSDPVAEQQRGYLYDPIGNRTSTDIAGAATDYSTNQLNQYTNIAVMAPAYDPDGNMTTAPDGMHYTYNAENRLIAAQPQSPADGDTRAEFVYDYMGRRVQKVVYTYSAGAWNPTKEILFVYDGWNLVKETTIPGGGSSVDKYYVWGLDLSQSLQGAGGVGGLLATIDGSLIYQYLYDANGNVGQLVDAADGSIAARYEYDPYGNLTDLGGAYADVNVYRFSTKYFDAETNLHYYGYRYYSHELGRWINRDPIGEKGGNNIFGFINNNPIGAIDLLGLYDPIKEAKQWRENLRQELQKKYKREEAIREFHEEKARREEAKRLLEQRLTELYSSYRKPDIPGDFLKSHYYFHGIRYPMPEPSDANYYLSAEVHAVVGIGFVGMECCDKSYDRRAVLYFKVCSGAALDVGVSGGTEFFKSGDKDTCKNPPKLIVAEFGVPLFSVLGLEAAYNIDVDSGAERSDSASGGVSVGLGGKATVCKYYRLGNTRTGCCKGKLGDLK